jgi:F0F1-type ATP synthase membrane subunit b/b'
MENFDQIFTLFAKEEGIHLNFDILETGLPNIIVLVGILVYIGKDLLGSQLEERQQNIIRNVEESEAKLYEANTRLNEAQKQLNQAEVIFEEIKKETLNTKKMLLKADSSKANQDLAICFNRAITTLLSREQQVFSEVKEQIIKLTLKNALLVVFKEKVAFHGGEEAYQNHIINCKIWRISDLRQI